MTTLQIKTCIKKIPEEKSSDIVFNSINLQRCYQLMQQFSRLYPKTAFGYITH